MADNKFGLKFSDLNNWLTGQQVDPNSPILTKDELEALAINSTPSSAQADTPQLYASTNDNQILKDLVSNPNQKPVQLAMDIPPQIEQPPRTLKATNLNDGPIKTPIKLLDDSKPVGESKPNPELVKEYIKKKYGFGDGLDDAALKSAQADAAQQRYLAMMGDAASTIGNAMTGRKHDSSFYNNLAANAGQGVKDIQDRRKASIENDKMKAMQAGQDPDSDKSKGKRDLYKKLFPEIVKNMPGFEILSSDDIEELKSPLELAQRAKDRVLQIQLMKEEKKSLQQQKIEEKRRLSDKQVDAINDFDSTIARAQDAMVALGDNSGWTGSVDGRIPDMMVGNDQVAWRSAVGRMSDAYRKLITGAGASNMELKRLEGRLPQPTDTFENFKAKANDLIREASKAKQQYLQNLNRNGKNINEYLAEQPGVGTQSTNSNTKPRWAK